MRRGVMFGSIVGQIGWAWSPVISKLALGVLALYPVETHVH